jgi:hypothetical protein
MEAAASTTVKATTASSVRSASSAATNMTATTALGEGWRRKADEGNRSESCEKCFQQGGLAHCFLHQNGGV